MPSIPRRKCSKLYQLLYFFREIKFQILWLIDCNAVWLEVVSVGTACERAQPLIYSPNTARTKCYFARGFHYSRVYQLRSENPILLQRFLTRILINYTQIMSNRTVWWIDGWMDGSLDGIGMAWKRIYANVHDHWLTFWKITLKTHSVCHKSQVTSRYITDASESLHRKRLFEIYGVILWWGCRWWRRK